MATYIPLRDPSGHYRSAARLDDGRLVVYIGNYTVPATVAPEREHEILRYAADETDDED